MIEQQRLEVRLHITREYLEVPDNKRILTYLSIPKYQVYNMNHFLFRADTFLSGSHTTDVSNRGVQALSVARHMNL